MPVEVGRVGEAVEELRAALTREFGATHLDVSVRVEGPHILGEGTVAVAALRGRLLTWLVERFPGASVDLSGVRDLAVTSWCLLREGETDVHRRLGDSGPEELATQVRPVDGPAGVLLRRPTGVLVRLPDATVGWVVPEALGDETRAANLVDRGRPSPVAVVRECRRYLGVPYRLGGSGMKIIDCSGLVQRAFRDAAGIVLPRHSGDQRKVAAHADGDETIGDLVFTWGPPEQRRHVGIVAERDGVTTIVHASLTRREVVEEPLTAVLNRSDRVERVAFADVSAWWNTQVGRAWVGA